MAAFKVFVMLFALFAMAHSMPGGLFGGKHEHIKIHVPYNVHTIHHTHVKKIHVPYPVHVVKEVPVVKEIIKEVPVYKEVHVPVHVHHESHHEDHGYSGHGW